MAYLVPPPHNKIRVFEAFSGIGAQNKALSQSLNNKYEIVATSEWDINSIISYDCIHYGSVKETHVLSLLKKYIDKKYILKNGSLDVDSYLSLFTFSKNGKDPIENSKLLKLPTNLKNRLALANIRIKNLGNITEITKSKLKFCDLLTYSFPCQDLSCASMGHGMGMNKNSMTRSGLVWEIQRILEIYKKMNALPKVLLLENVGNMISKTFKPQYKKWCNSLKKLGYKTITIGEDDRNKILNASWYGLPQNRRRIFAISYLNKNGNKSQKLFNEINKRAKYKNWSTEKWKKFTLKKFLFINDPKKRNESLNAKVNMTPSRIRFLKEAEKKGIIYSKNINPNKFKLFPTLTTKQDRWPNSGFVKDFEKNNEYYRFITPRESFLLMGFKQKDFENIKRDSFGKNFNREIYWKQAGNSIAVNVLQAIFESIFELFF